jgi:uncharacterized membrane protein YjjP (DUF1212 family)
LLQFAAPSNRLLHFAALFEKLKQLSLRKNFKKMQQIQVQPAAFSSCMLHFLAACCNFQLQIPANFTQV